MLKCRSLWQGISADSSRLKYDFWIGFAHYTALIPWCGDSTVYNKVVSSLVLL